MEIREQAGICLDLLDHYQSSVPGRMWSDAERKCQPLREELKRTEMLFRTNSGEWEGRNFKSWQFRRNYDWMWDDVYGPGDDVGRAGAHTRDESPGNDLTSHLAPSRHDVQAYHRRTLDNLMALVDEETARGRAPTGPLTFRLPTDRGSSQQNMLVLVPGETGLVYEHEYGGVGCQHVEIEGFLVPAWAEPEAWAALDQLFRELLDGKGVGDHERSDAVQIARDAVEQIWYRGTGDRMAPLQIDDERADELDEAWVPVLTPDGPAYLVWTNGD